MPIARIFGAILFLVSCGPILSRDVSQPISDLMWKSPSGKYSLLISTGEVGSDGNASGCVILLHQTEGQIRLG